MKLWKSKPIPQYSVETTPTQLRMIRTHMAAQASEISTLTTQLSMIRGLLSQVLERLPEGPA